MTADSRCAVCFFVEMAKKRPELVNVKGVDPVELVIGVGFALGMVAECRFGDLDDGAAAVLCSAHAEIAETNAGQLSGIVEAVGAALGLRRCEGCHGTRTASDGGPCRCDCHKVAVGVHVKAGASGAPS